MQRSKALLRIDTGAHVLAAAHQNAHAPGVHILERLLLGVRFFQVGHKDNLIRRYSGVAQALLEPRARIEPATFRHSCAKADVGEHHLRSALCLFFLASFVLERIVRAFFVGFNHAVGHHIQL